jgi:hypothetical protein
MEVPADPTRAAVDRALAGRTAVDGRDAGAEQLALVYAGLIDAPAPAAKYTKPLALIRRACGAYDDPDAMDAYRAIRDALGAHSVASDLGPKLLTTLDALGLTPKARAAGKGGSGDQPARPADPLDELRRKRRDRLARG